MIIAWPVQNMFISLIPASNILMASHTFYDELMLLLAYYDRHSVNFLLTLTSRLLLPNTFTVQVVHTMIKCLLQFRRRYDHFLLRYL